MFRVPAGQGTCPGFRYHCRTPACHPPQETLVGFKNTIHIPLAMSQDSFTVWQGKGGGVELIETAKYYSHHVCTLFIQAVTEGKESLLDPSSAHLTFFSLFCFFLHIHSNKLLNIKLQKNQVTVLGECFPSYMMYSIQTADIRGEWQV